MARIEFIRCEVVSMHIYLVDNLISSHVLPHLWNWNDLNRKIVRKRLFWCDKFEEISINSDNEAKSLILSENNSCVMSEIIGGKKHSKVGPTSFIQCILMKIVSTSYSAQQQLLNVWDPSLFWIFDKSKIRLVPYVKKAP